MSRRDFGKLWVGSGISNLGDGISFVAIPLLAASLTDSPELVAGLSFAYTLPRLLVAIISGALVDRMDRRLLMSAVNLTRGGVMTLLALSVALSWVSILVLYAVFVVLGLLETVADTSAFAVLPAIVEPEHLDRANGRLAATQTISDEFVGPPLGGILFGVAAALPILFDAASFVVAGILFLTLRGNYRAPPRSVNDPQPSMLQQISEGVAYVARHRLLLVLSTMLVITSLAYMIPFSVLVLFTTQELGLTPSQYGIVLAVSASGSLAGALAASRIRRWIGTGRAIGYPLLVGAFAYFVIASTDSVPLITAMLALYFFQTTVWSITTVSLRQVLVPDHMRGRAAGVNKTFGLTGLAVGSVVGGVVAGHMGLRAPLWCAGLLLAGAGLVAVFTVTNQAVRQTQRHAQRTDAAPETAWGRGS